MHVGRIQSALAKIRVSIKKKDWRSIQGKPQLWFNSLKIYFELFELMMEAGIKQGTSRMKETDGMSKERLHHYPGLCDVFNDNLFFSECVIKLYTCIKVNCKVHKPNLLVNDGIVSEQFVHSDLEYPSRSKPKKRKRNRIELLTK